MKLATIGRYDFSASDLVGRDAVHPHTNDLTICKIAEYLDSWLDHQDLDTKLLLWTQTAVATFPKHARSHY